MARRTPRIDRGQLVCRRRYRSFGGNDRVVDRAVDLTASSRWLEKTAATGNAGGCSGEEQLVAAPLLYASSGIPLLLVQAMLAPDLSIKSDSLSLTNRMA